MAGTGRGGKRIGLLPLIRRFEDQVEADLQRFHGVDYRDRFLPGGGRSRLTVRRLLLLVDLLPAESAFHSAREDRAPWSITGSAVMDVWEALAGKRHPGRLSPSERRQAAIDRVERERLRVARRREARAHNEQYLARRRLRASSS